MLTVADEEDKECFDQPLFAARDDTFPAPDAFSSKTRTCHCFDTSLDLS
jgi:hypothetical protein